MDYGLIGGRLGHSFSKEIHEKLADYTYELCPLTSEEFDPFMREHDFRAINVTIPYKQRVIPYLDALDPKAEAIGAVNTIVNREGKLTGYNTDYDGFWYTLAKHAVDLKDKKVLILGNGGAAQAVKACVRDGGAKEMLLVRRSKDDQCISYDEVYEKHTDVDVIINTSPVGMFPEVDAQPIDLIPFTQCQVVLDLIYNPIETKLTAQAKSLGMAGITGLEMLIAQAKVAVEIFLDCRIDDSRIDEIYQLRRSDHE
ncbi:MAG: shikimate dehydrogenase [Eubacterium sp.]|nr:shikimate dehydrogenase [Eubacterium sp.]